MSIAAVIADSIACAISNGGAVCIVCNWRDNASSVRSILFILSLCIVIRDIALVSGDTLVLGDVLVGLKRLGGGVLSRKSYTSDA